MPSFSYDFPYASKKLPIFAANVVASSQHLPATAGLRMLARGGNAVDAAIASAVAITVVEPTNNGIGADAFCILWDGSKLVGLNASGHSPALMTRLFDEELEKIQRDLPSEIDSKAAATLPEARRMAEELIVQGRHSQI